jgi:broad specificity phosphatase PhoE
MTRVLLIHAGPTPWDEEDRVVGARPLPLSDAGVVAVSGAVASIDDDVHSVYAPRTNEACLQAAVLIGSRWKLRVRDAAGLGPIALGLWEGLTREELRQRYETAFPRWEEQPLDVNPPEGEALAQAIERVRNGLRRVLRRKRGQSVAVALRPVAMQIAAGLLRGEQPRTMAAHLHKVEPLVTIELSDQQLHQLLS